MQTPTGNPQIPAPQKRPLWRRLRARLVPRITLRRFFILFTLLCIFLGGVAFWRQRAVQQHIACEQLAKANWSVAFEDSTADDAKWSPWFRSLPEWTREGSAFHLWFRVRSIYGNQENLRTACRAASRLSYVGELDFRSEEELTPQDCAAIAKIRNLKSLELEGAIIDDAGLAEIAKLTNLESLDLAGTKVGNDGVRHLAKLKKLKNLNLSQTNIDDQVLADLATLTNLENLYLYRTNITSAGLAKLASLQHLEYLDVEGTHIDDQIAVTIAGIPYLEQLNVCDGALSDATCAKMLHQPSLSWVNLNHTQVGQKTLDALVALPNLIEVQLRGVPLKPGELQALAAAKKLIFIEAPRNTTIDDLVAFHQHPSLECIRCGPFQYSIEKLKLLAGAPSQESELYIDDLALGDANWRHVAKNSSLRRLMVSSSDLNDQALVALAKSKTLVDLDIANCPITEAGLRQIADFTNLESLRLSKVPLNDEGLKHFAKLAKLETLVLEDCGQLTEAGLASISSLPNLRTISASPVSPIDPPLHDSILLPPMSEREQSLQSVDWGRIALEEANLDLFRNRPIAADHRRLHLGPQSRLTTLQLSLISIATELTEITIEGPAILEDQFTALGPLPNLRRINLDAARLSPNLLHWLAAQPDLRDLELDNLELTGDAARIISASRTLDSVQLTNVKLGPGALRRLADLPDLKSISLTNCQLEDSDLLQLSGAESLTWLAIADTPLTPKTLAQLLPKFPRLDSLSLTNCSLDVSALDAITSNAKQLKFLSLDKNTIKLDDLHPRLLELPKLERFSVKPEAWHWALRIGLLPWIRWDLLRSRNQAAPRPPPDSNVLYLHHVGPRLAIGNRWIGDDLAIEIVRANPKIDHLDLSDGAIGSKLLAELANTDHVQDLTLANTKIGDDLSALAKLTRVRKLDLTGCNITDRGVEILVQSCPRLEQITLDKTKITNQSLKHLAKLQFLESIGLFGTAVDNTGLQEIRNLKHLEDVNVTETQVTPEAFQLLGPASKTWLRGPEVKSAEVQNYDPG